MARRDQRHDLGGLPRLTDESQRLADTYIAYEAGKSDDDFWAWDRMMTLAMDEPELAWALLLHVVARAPDEQLSAIGAGLLETLLSQHGTTYGARAVEQGRRDPRFRECLSAVWLQPGDVPADVAERFAELTRGGVRIF
ncbi:MAG TPA: hypothetical protein VFJ16_00365 [Longimicrobium sp.]|nr:hypothetical protein [Longimicrobium sp.]